ncbi:MAG: 6-phosphofructokinase [Pirellulaceae bacterium]|nr:6-phosphofructokinase [Planctomycetales bacterium]MCA9161849.1 6-phosphofructokinase [Planctomycetales bacterium]MCA9226602.1 6-phosphofructokinase [Planctomycetales bacterium]
MKRIGILTAGGDTPALNATIHGAVARANQLRVEVIGLMKGFGSLLDPRVPHVRLNPLFGEIPELDPTKGGTLLGASRDYVDPSQGERLDGVCERLKQLNIDGLICIGGDGTLNGLQPLCERIPTVLAPKTIDNDLGLNYSGEANHWKRTPSEDGQSFSYSLVESRIPFDREQMINYVTPGYATAVFVSASGVERIRTTAESHRRIAIIEVMGRHSGYIALGSAYGQPDMVLIPETPVNMELLVERVKEIYDLQSNVVIVCGEGIVDEAGVELGAEKRSTDPAGNLLLSGAAEALRRKLMEAIGDEYFRAQNRNDSAKSAIFTRKVGHTQRGGRPLRFDRYCASQLGGKAVDMLLEGQNNAVATLQWTAADGFHVSSFDGNGFRDQWGKIHARPVHPALYDPSTMLPSREGVEYLLPIFTNAIGPDDMEHARQTLFDSGNLYRRYHSVNVDITKRIRYLDSGPV